MRYRPIDREPDDPRLSRFIPDDLSHLTDYPLSAVPEVKRRVAVPVVIGVSWYTEFWEPEEDARSGEFWVARGGPTVLTERHGGHCVCLEPGESKDREEWWSFYDQGQEGACVGFGWSRCMSLLNGELYAARWLWDRAKETDEWSETNPGDDNGTSVRSAGLVLWKTGHVDWADAMADDSVSERADYRSDPENGIASFAWASSVDEVHTALANPRADSLGAVPFLNSWGQSYPRRTWMPDEVLDRLMSEPGGEVAVPTDR